MGLEPELTSIPECEFEYNQPYNTFRRLLAFLQPEAKLLAPLGAIMGNQLRSPRKSLQYGTEGFKGGCDNQPPIMPRIVSLSDGQNHQACPSENQVTGEKPSNKSLPEKS